MAKKSVEAKLLRHENPFVIFDLETGGLDKTKHGLAEIGAVSMDWNLNDFNNDYCEIIKPYDDNLTYAPQALQVNGLTMEDLNNGKDFKETIKSFAEYLKSFTKLPSKKKPVLVGHNIQDFDIPWLAHCFQLCGLDLYKYFDSFIDTLNWARHKYTNVENFKLGTICNMNGIQINNAHSALGDVYANRELAKIMIRSLRGEGNLDVKKEEKRFRQTFQF